jgi:hypothetical protein
METTLTPDLDELSRLLEQATPGPWKVYEFFPHCHEVCNADNYATGAVCVPPKQANAALIAALRNSAEELVRDARRMEWAEKHMNAIDTVSHPDNLVMIWHGPHEASAAGRTLRAAIDAAIAQEQPNSSATLTGSDEGK